ncbi:MAG: cytochrome c oxidase accessory protein CcoG [Planctomycetota bacterium]
MTSLLQPDERVLSTLNADGSRRWLDPRHVTGFFRKRRQVVGWILIAIFCALPFVHVGGRQFFQFDIFAGEFTIFGLVLARNDTLLLALFAITTGIAVFLATALFGRVWCGWACPQTVYLEFVFRPIARLFDGKGRKGLRGFISKIPRSLRNLLRWALVAAICFHLANTFLSYFVGSATVFEWSLNWPWVHPGGFFFVVFVTGLMLFNFGFFREQLCIIACPYGRLQSVLLDRQSLIVGYDKIRGEPRGKKRRGKAKTAKGEDISLRVVGTADDETVGDCIDCNMCTAVCPTGIDIRDGLQLECIHCARCIDACNDVMDRLGRDRGLIRYSSESSLAGESKRFLRARIVAYPIVLAIVLTSLLGLALTRADADVRIIRETGQPYHVLGTGEVANPIRFRVTNRTSEPKNYVLTPGMEGFRLAGESTVEGVANGETRSAKLQLIATTDAMLSLGSTTNVPIIVTDGEGFESTRFCKFIAPTTRARSSVPGG